MRLPQMSGYAKHFDSNLMSFHISNNNLLKKYTEIWEKISGLIGKKFDSEPVWGTCLG